MNFHLSFPIEPLPRPIGYEDTLLMTGSCFAEEVGGLLQARKFNVQLNPHGILYNPLSLVTALNACLEKKNYTSEDLFYLHEQWHSWDHHGRFSNTIQEKCLEKINASRKKGTHQLAEADWLILTLGSAHVYSLKENSRVVGNCHKAPAHFFTKRLLRTDEIISALDNFIHKLFFSNKKVKILFSVSPVRYVRDGVVENQLSKASLLLAIHHLISKFDRLYYFPAYELVTDDLRDYRFFKEDLVHPNEMAIQYVWEKFTCACINPESVKLMKQIEPILQAVAHRPLYGNTLSHLKFLETLLEKTDRLNAKYPSLDFSTEREFFQRGINEII